MVYHKDTNELFKFLPIVVGFRKKFKLGKGPKIKKCESMVFDHILPTPPPPNLNYGLFTQNFFHPIFLM